MPESHHPRPNKTHPFFEQSNVAEKTDQVTTTMAGAGASGNGCKVACGRLFGSGVLGWFLDLNVQLQFNYSHDATLSHSICEYKQITQSIAVVVWRYIVSMFIVLPVLA